MKNNLRTRASSLAYCLGYFLESLSLKSMELSERALQWAWHNQQKPEAPAEP